MPGERGEMRYRYVGKRDEGEHLSGVPAVNLYDDDLMLLDADQKKAVAKSAIYKKVEAEGAPAASSSEGGAKATSSTASQNKADADEKPAAGARR